MKGGSLEPPISSLISLSSPNGLRLPSKHYRASPSRDSVPATTTTKTLGSGAGVFTPPETRAPQRRRSPYRSPRGLTCRPGSAPPPRPRPAAPAGSGRPAGRPAVLLRARASRPSLPPSAVRPARAPSLLASAAALYPGSRSPLPAGSRTPRLKGTSSYCLGAPSPSTSRAPRRGPLPFRGAG